MVLVETRRREVYHSLVHEGFCHGLSSQKEGRYSYFHHEHTQRTDGHCGQCSSIVRMCACGGVSSTLPRGNLLNSH